MVIKKLYFCVLLSETLHFQFVWRAFLMLGNLRQAYVQILSVTRTHSVASLFYGHKEKIVSMATFTI